MYVCVCHRIASSWFIFYPRNNFTCNFPSVIFNNICIYICMYLHVVSRKPKGNVKILSTCSGSFSLRKRCRLARHYMRTHTCTNISMHLQVCAHANFIFTCMHTNILISWYKYYPCSLLLMHKRKRLKWLQTHTNTCMHNWCSAAHTHTHISSKSYLRPGRHFGICKWAGQFLQHTHKLIQLFWIMLYNF